MENLRKKTREAIDSLHERLKECQIAMLIDQETGLVLCKSAASPSSQTLVEQVANDALAELRSQSAQSFHASVDEPQLLSLTRVAKTAVTVIIQDLRSEEDALVLVFNKQPNRAYLMDVAAEIFELPISMEAA